jgi:hypothetical protein
MSTATVFFVDEVPSSQMPHLLLTTFFSSFSMPSSLFSSLLASVFLIWLYNIPFVCGRFYFSILLSWIMWIHFPRGMFHPHFRRNRFIRFDRSTLLLARYTEHSVRHNGNRHRGNPCIAFPIGWIGPPSPQRRPDLVCINNNSNYDNITQASKYITRNSKMNEQENEGNRKRLN